MIQLRVPISAVLEADGDLDELVDGRIYHQVAPENAAYPMVIFHKQGGGQRRTWGDEVKDDLWTIKAVGLKSDDVEPIELAIDAAITDAELAVGGETIWLRRDSDVNYSEEDGATTYRHLGGVYRVMVD